MELSQAGAKGTQREELGNKESQERQESQSLNWNNKQQRPHRQSEGERGLYQVTPGDASGTDEQRNTGSSWWWWN